MKNIKTNPNPKQEKYWTDRFQLSQSMGDKTETEILKTMQTVYKESLSRIDKEINAFYGKYAEQNTLTISDVKKRLDPMELKSAKEEIARYYHQIDKLTRKGGKVQTSLLRQYSQTLKEQSAKAYLSRLEELKISITHEAVKLGVRESEVFDDKLGNLYNDTYSHKSYEIDKYKGFSNGFSERNVEKAINERWLGANYSDNIWKNKDKLVNNIETVFLQGLVRGQNPKKIAGELNRVMNTSFYNCERLCRTETIHILNKANYDSYRDHGIEKYQFVCGLDERTCAFCGGRDGEIFTIKEKMEGFNYPVLHPNCRCTTIPYFEPDEIDEMFEESTRIAKDEDGEYYDVPSSMTYKEWQEMTSRKPTMSVNKVVKYVKEEKPEYYDEDFKNFLDDSNKEWENITNNEVDLNKLIDSLEKIDKYDVVNPIKMADKDIIKQASEYYNRHRNDGVYVPKIVNVKDIETRQDWLDRSKLEDFAKGFDKSKYKGDEIRGIEYKGHIILVDGNHRTAIALLRNQKTIKIEILQ